MLDDVLSASAIWINSAPYWGRFLKHLPFEALQEIQNVLRVNIISFIPLNLTCSISNFTIWHLPISRAKEHLNVRSYKKRKEAYTWRLLNLNFYMHFVKYKMDHRREMSLYAPFWLCELQRKQKCHIEPSPYSTAPHQAITGTKFRSCLAVCLVETATCLPVFKPVWMLYVLMRCTQASVTSKHSTWVTVPTLVTFLLSLFPSLSFKRWKKT